MSLIIRNRTRENFTADERKILALLKCHKDLLPVYMVSRKLRINESVLNIIIDDMAARNILIIKNKRCVKYNEVV